MRRSQDSNVVHAVTAPSWVDGSVVAELDNAIEGGAHEIVLDLTETAYVDDDTLPLLVWLAQKLEDGGGRLQVTARRALEASRLTRPLRAGDLTQAVGVHPALDRAILNRLRAGAGGMGLR